MDAASEYGRVIDLLYDPVPNPTRWNAVLHSTAKLIGAQSGFFRVVDMTSNCISIAETVGYDPEYVRQYREHFIQVDPYRRSFRQAPVGALLLTHQLVDPQVHRKTAYFNEYERPQDKIYAAGATVSRSAGSTIEIGFQRGERAGPFLPEQTNMLKSLFPHIKRAVGVKDLFGQIASVESLAVEALNQLPAGLVLVDDNHRPRYINPAAEALFAAHDIKASYRGIELRFVIGTEALRALVARASAGESGELTGLAGAPRLRWAAAPLSADRVAAELQVARGAVALYVSETTEGARGVEAFASRYGLTQAESRLIARLAEGMSVQEIASKYGVSVHTVRCQLGACFSKTGTCRQAQLVALLGATGSGSH